MTDNFLQDHTKEKADIIHSFNSAAVGYDVVSVLQKTVGERLLDRLELMRISPQWILDTGSGTGLISRSLKKQYRRSAVLQMDIAENMLHHSRKQSRWAFSKNHFLCADADQMPLSSQAMDMIFSNQMLQWGNDLDHLFAETFRILNNKGLFIFSTLGPDTLCELRESWSHVDDYTHVNPFIDMHDVGDALIRAGFTDPVMELEYINMSYKSVYDLMHDLKKLGAHNINSGRQRSLTGKNKFKQMVSEYEKKKVEGRLPATYEVIYGHTWAPDANARMSTDGQTAVIPLEVLKKSLHVKAD